MSPLGRERRQAHVSTANAFTAAGERGVDMSLGGGEILVILLVALMVFGPQRMPEIARQLGKGIRELRKMQDTVRQELHGALQVDGGDGIGQGVPSYDDPQPGAPYQADSLQADSHRGEPSPLPPVDPPSAGSFS